MEGWQQRNTAVSNKILSNNYTEFNSKFSTRVDGKEINTRKEKA
jgi:hypothetical protein